MRLATKKAAVADLDERITAYTVDKYKSELVQPEYTQATMQNAYIIELDWLNE